MMEAGRRHLLSPVPLTSADTALLQYTGGTTGVPKAAMLTHGNLVANVAQTREWVRQVLQEGAEVGLIPLPMTHVFALVVALVLLRFGAHSVLAPNPRELEALVKLLGASRATVLVGANTLYNAMLGTEAIRSIDTSRLKIAIAGGAAVQSVVAARWFEVFGLPIIEGYGLTECSAVVSANPLTIRKFTGTVGLPLPSTEVAILDEAGRRQPPGEQGEIAVRGPQVMAGYWNRPAETAQAITLDGWLHTGDLGTMDEQGFLRIADRIRDVIVVSGIKVFPSEVEEVAMLHPAVVEAVAVGMPDAHSGEAVQLVLVSRDPALTAQAMLEHCRQHLSGYKVPQLVTFRKEPLPKSNIGKVLRRAVRDEEAAARA